MKLLFMHNAIPEYRIPWFKEVSKLCDAHFVFTNEKIIKKLYHFDTDFSTIADLDYELSGKGLVAIKNTWRILKSIQQYEAILFPPIDTLHEFWISTCILLIAKKYGIKTSYFWEKWEAPKELQPLNVDFLCKLH